MDERLLRFAAGFLIDEPVEGQLPAYTSVNQLLEESAIFRFELLFLKKVIENRFDETAVFPLEEGFGCNFSWFFRAH